MSLHNMNRSLTSPHGIECTSFVAWRINSRLDIKFTNQYKGALWGNADTWAGAAGQTGVTVNNNPVPGCIAWLGDYENGAGSAGHVAWVAAVGSDTVTIEEYNWGTPLVYHTRTVAKDQFSYIHVKV
jgi:surface antigen